MKYRLLNEGEKIQTGDEFYEYGVLKSKWSPVPAPVLGITYQNDYLAIRRPALESDERTKQVIEILEKIARLGNGENYGNSIGNCLAQDALKLLKNE